MHRRFLPLPPPREERAGERRAILMGLPLSPALSPLVPRGEREETGAVTFNFRFMVTEFAVYCGAASRPLSKASI